MNFYLGIALAGLALWFFMREPKREKVIPLSEFWELCRKHGIR